MDEFSLIKTYFQAQTKPNADVIVGIGDDAAVLQIAEGMQLVVSCDTLVADVHFLSDWDAFAIAYRAVMVNMSDIAAMAAKPNWVTLAITLPNSDDVWLQRFSQGLHHALQTYHLTLIGGDTTRGPLSITLTIHGIVEKGKAVQRSGAKPGDKIYVSGELGAAAFALTILNQADFFPSDRDLLMDKLLYPTPRVDLAPILQTYATSCIDISDGLSADLFHICELSHVGAVLQLDAIPIHPVVKKYQGVNALDFALGGGDDYELCFTVSPEQEHRFMQQTRSVGITCYCIGYIDAQQGLRAIKDNGESLPLAAKGYKHFNGCGDDAGY